MDILQIKKEPFDSSGEFVCLEVWQVGSVVLIFTHRTQKVLIEAAISD